MVGFPSYSGSLLAEPGVPSGFDLGLVILLADWRSHHVSVAGLEKVSVIGKVFSLRQHLAVEDGVFDVFLGKGRG